jgi:hypothetical protein
MKSVAIVSLALAGSALARSTIHHEVRQPVQILNADNELHNYYSMPGNQGNIQFNDYSKTHDDELFGLGINVKSEVNNFPHNSGTIVISHDDEADNELHNYYSMSDNQGNIQFNDYTVSRRDATEDDELWGLDVKVKSEVNNFPHNSGNIRISHDDETDNELHKYFSMSGNQGEIQFNDYTVSKKDATEDDELWGLGVDIKSEVNNFPHNSGTIIISHDDEADNELNNYYNMPGNQGNIQFNDYSKTHDDDNELWGLDVGIKSEVNNFPYNSGTIVISHDDEADNELHNYYSMSDNQGNIQFNDYSKTHDDEFVARPVEKLTKDEIQVLAALLKVASQDKDGNVVVDGVKIGKIAKQEVKKIETPKTKKFLAL